MCVGVAFVDVVGGASPLLTLSRFLARCGGDNPEEEVVGSSRDVKNGPRYYCSIFNYDVFALSRSREFRWRYRGGT